MPKEPTTKSKSKREIVAQSNPNLADQIRRRAYELYEARGREEGYELDDWLHAEAEITEE